MPSGVIFFVWSSYWQCIARYQYQTKQYQELVKSMSLFRFLSNMFSILLPFLLSYWTIYRCLYLSTRFMLLNGLLHSVSWTKFSWDRWLLLSYVCDFVLLQSVDISSPGQFIIYFWDHSNSKAQLIYFLYHRTPHLISSTCKKPSSGLFLCASLIIFIIIIIHFRNSLKKATNHLCSAYRYTYIFL